MTPADKKWEDLEKDVVDAIRPIIEKHQEKFDHDSYAVIGAIEDIFDGMFQKVNR